ncbi:MAG: MFS family permease [Kiritimatiellia bacterium]|jgi:MFS family permease
MDMAVVLGQRLGISVCARWTEVRDMTDSSTTPHIDEPVATIEEGGQSGGSGGPASMREGWLSPNRQVFLGLLAAYLGLGMFVPVMAPLVRALGLTEFQGGLIFAVEYLVWMLASPLWGGRADVWGRKPIILLGLIGFSVGHVLFGLTADFGLWGWMSGLPVLILLVATRGLAGALFSATPPAAQAYVVDRSALHERTRAVALLGAAAGIGSVVGPGLIWVVSQFEALSLSAPLYLAAAMPVVPTILLWLFLPKEKVIKTTEKPPVLWVWDQRIAAVLVVGLVLNVAIALLLFTLGFFLQDRLGLNDFETTRASSLAMLMVGVVAVIVQVGVLRVLTWSPVTLLRVGLSIMAVGTGLLIFSGSELTIDLSVVVIGLGYAFAYPGFQAAISFAVGAKEQGAVAGLAAATGAVAFVIGPVLGTLMYQYEPISPYILSTAVLIAGAAFAMLHPRLRQIRKVSQGHAECSASAIYPVDAEEFETLFARVENELLPSQRFVLMRSISEAHHLSCQQVRRFMMLFTFGSDRVAVAALFLGRLSDPDAIELLLETLSTDADRDVLRAAAAVPGGQVDRC